MQCSVFVFALYSYLTIVVPANEITNGISNFAWDFYRQCINATSGNMIISPFSVTTALSLLLQGSNGETSEQIRNGLHLIDNKIVIADHFSKHFELLENAAENTTLSMVNQIYVQQGLHLSGHFQEIAIEKFRSGIELIDFANKDNAVQTINDYVEKKTFGKINNLIESKTLDSDTRMVLINAIYFHGDWMYQFNENDTHKGAFFISETENITVDFMVTRGVFGWALLKELDAIAFEMKYVDSSLSFVIVLPNSRTGLPMLEAQFKPDLMKNNFNYSKNSVAIIPKFKVEFKIDLIDTLKNLGMSEMFTNKADLNGLLEVHEDLYVSDVVHKAFIEINERGSDAAAATAFALRQRIGPRKFHANHPFLYYIWDRDTDTILFNGRIVNFHSHSLFLCLRASVFCASIKMLRLVITLVICSMLFPNIFGNEIKSSIRTFASDFYQECAKSTSGNVIVSPISVANALMLLSQAANGRTFEGIKSGLRINVEKSVAANQFHDYYESLQHNVGAAILSTANLVYVQQGYKLKKTFQNVAVEDFDSAIGTVNFANKVETAQFINQMVEQKTNRKIKNLIKSDMFDSDSRVVLVNAIYFKGDWMHKFNKQFTTKNLFYTNKEQAKSVDFMHTDATFNYGHLIDMDATALEMNYYNSNYSMVFILPNELDGINVLENQLRGYDFTKISHAMHSHQVEVHMPKFKVEFEIKLNDVLKNMGFAEMFTSNADLSGLLEVNEPLFVSDAVHKAVIEVNEEGSEAAAATGLVITKRIGGSGQLFIADHPFIYYIWDKNTKTIVFIGRLTNFS
ncbi:thyroxine-binding globulin-like [Contarinia nasturtii]|uniref:thyroxine-binding globulin-like n=1 Tax=Contarinia nasturtii TaxID=265458 RepID=UPI0012D4B063|nr:thyroxine-binding globulin-like [Contarinia nasturtii]